MSRIGKQPVIIPAGVTVAINGNHIEVTGKLGKLDFQASDRVFMTVEEGKVIVKPADNSIKAKAAWGLTRSIVKNLVKGVSEGFAVKLEVNGVGYRASVDKKILTLFLGYSHEIKYLIPADIKIECEKPTLIVISGINIQKVGQVAATIRRLRKPEPYKGKGVKYENEYIVRKVGKKKK